MTTVSQEPLATQSAVLHAAGLGIQVLTGELDHARAQLAARDERGTANLERLDRITLRLYELAMELERDGGKVSARKLADKLLEIRANSAR